MPKQYTVHVSGGTSLSGHTSAEMIFYTKKEASKYASNWRKNSKYHRARISSKEISKTNSDYMRYKKYKKSR